MANLADHAGQRDDGGVRPTLIEVARIAGVSTATVSRVASGSGPVGDETRARVEDAIADLKLAGFRASDIGVCNSEQGRQAQLSAHPAGKHSLWWRLRHSAQFDLKAHGTSLTNEGYLEKATREDTPYTELELAPAMRSMGVGEDTIQLMDREIGPGGFPIDDQNLACTLRVCLRTGNAGR